MDKLFLIDASGYLYRSYFAIRHMTNSKGESTNALFGFTRSLLKLLKDFQPTYIAAIFDGPSNSRSRSAIYADYKAHRQETPKDLIPQIDRAKHLCTLMGIHTLCVEGVEADDTLGSIATWASGIGSQVILCTSDKDMCQMVNDHIFILNTFKDNQLIGKKEVEEIYGVRPDQIIDYLALTGDTSDNVPGVSGFGPKTASELLQQLGTLEEILNNPQLVPGKKKQETLITEKEKALLSQKLVTLDTHVPFEKDENFFRIKTCDKEELVAFYQEMNFVSLIRELDEHVFFKEKVITTNQDNHLHYTLVDDEDSLKSLIQQLSSMHEICLDTEATSLHPMQAKLVGIGFGIRSHEAWYIPTHGKLGFAKVIESIKPLLENPHIGFFGHNIKYDAHVLQNAGIHIAHISFDTLLASYLLNSHSRQHSLDFLALECFGKIKIPIEDLIGKGKHQLNMNEVPIEKVCSYCCEDVDYTFRLKELLTPQLKERGLLSLYYDIELPIISVLLKMERQGIFVDSEKLSTLSRFIKQQIDHLTEDIYLLAGEPFNLNSPKQLSVILFEKLGIPAPKKTATGLSTNAEVLESLKDKHPIAAKLLEYRTLEKLRSTYVDILPTQIDPKTGRIHCTFNQSVTATGRLSCQDPNLQNIPVRTEVGRQIREAFRPQKESWSYMSADYSQIELRLLAHLSEDPVLIEAFQKGEDIHTFTASQIFNIPVSEVSSEQRSLAKTVNFGIMYGQGAYGLSNQLGIDPKTAADFIQKYFSRYQKVKEFIEICKERAKTTGKAISFFGRERLIPEIRSSNAHIRAAAERLAVNTPLQGTQADLIKKAMEQIDRVLSNSHMESFLILQIHDELLFEVPDHEIGSLKQIVHSIMTEAMSLKVPLVVNINIGKNWKEC